MSSLHPPANGGRGGMGRQHGSQGGPDPRGGTNTQSAGETTYHSAVSVDFNGTGWKSEGKPVPSFKARLKDIASVTTKNCKEAQLAPLPHLPGGENLPSVGRADKTADDIFTITDDDFKFYAIYDKTIVERSNGRIIHRGVFGIKSTIPLKDIKLRKEVAEHVNRKGITDFFH